VAERLAITFVLPVLGETDSLRTTVETIVRLAAEHLHEMLIVTADHTSENSLNLARGLREQYPGRIRIHKQQLPFLGGAIREAFGTAGGSHVMLMASDLETDPEMVPRFIAKMQQGDCDVVAGSRWLAGGGFEGYGRLRKLLNRVFQWCFARLYGTRLTDLTFGYRLYRREVLEGVRWNALGHPFLLECLLKPLRLGARVVEVPCRWRSRSEGSSAGSLRQMLGYVPLALRVRLTPRRRLRQGNAAHGDAAKETSKDHP